MRRADQYHRQTRTMKAVGNVWFPTMIGLHSMILGPILLVGLAACGTAASPSGYVWTNATDLMYLSWNKQNGQLSGTSTSISYASTPFASATTPAIFTAGYRGTQDGTTVHLTLHTLFAPALTGTQSSEGQTLTFNVPDPATGQMHPTTWVAVSAEQEQALVAAFEANEVVRGMLPIVQQDVRSEPTPWMDQNRRYIAQIHSEVQADQQMLTTNQQAHDETVQCQDVQRFQYANMLTSTVFVFAFVPADAALMRHLATLKQAWKQAKQSPIPQIAGLPASQLSWVVTPAQYQAGTRTAMHIAAQIARSKRADTAQLQALLRQYQRIMQTEQAIAKSCPGT
jgi:hypothetical protein